MMFWRFLPRFVTDPKKFKLSMINAKSETLLNNHMWQDSFLKRRCIVPVDTFLEWRKEGKRRLPMYSLWKTINLLLSAAFGVTGVSLTGKTIWTPSPSSRLNPTN